MSDNPRPMRCSLATPYAETAALQANTATNPRKTLVAMESRIDLHSSAHATGLALSCSRRGLRRHGLAGARRGARRRPALGRVGRPGSGAARDRFRRRPRARGDDDAGLLAVLRAHSGLLAAPQGVGSVDRADAPLRVASRTLRGDGPRTAV